MPLSTEVVPNLPLTGPELKRLILWSAEQALEKEWVFMDGTSYPRVAFSVEIVMHFANPNMKPQVVRARVPAGGAVEGEPPLADVEDSGVRAVVVEQEPVDNPNLLRVHAEMPIEIVKAQRPEPGKLFGQVTKQKVHYDKRDYPDRKALKITDVSKKKSEALGIQYNLNDPEELDALGTEEE